MQCPDCSLELSLPEEPQVGSVIICTNCGAEIEITSLDPLQIQTIEEMK